jgi:hypothetical protein
MKTTALFTVIFVQVKLDLRAVGTFPLGLAVFTGLVFLNVLLFRSDR